MANNPNPRFTPEQLGIAENVLAAIADEVEEQPKPSWRNPLDRVSYHYLHSVALHLERFLRQQRRQIQSQESEK